MATRLHYALPFIRQLIASTSRQAQGRRAVDVRAEGRPFIIVTGLGRSGTSAVARVLHESGLSMGEHFREPTEENETGFYEELPVCDLNDEIMAECGIAGLRRYPMRTTVLTVAGRFRERMRALAQTDVSGWKDPRLSVTLEAWLPHLPGPPKLIICLRSSEAFLHSVSQIFGLIDRDLVERRWSLELLRLLDVVRDYELDATCVEYDNLVTHPEQTVAEIAAFVDHPLDASLVKPNLRHFAYHIPHRLAPLYDRVRALGPNKSPRDAGARPPTPEVVDAYVQQIGDVDKRIESAKEKWTSRVGAPDLNLLFYTERGLDQAEVRAESREASQSYVETLSEAQTELGALRPPAGFEDYHEATRAAVNDARLIAQLMLQASELKRPVEEVVKAYQLRLSPEALKKTQERRAQAFGRAQRTATEATASG